MNRDNLNRLTRPKFLNSKGDVIPDTTGYQRRHELGVGAMTQATINHERALVFMLSGWAIYADAHARLGSKIGTDYVFGPEFAAIGRALRGLLNSETGPRLHCGTLDAFILDTLAANECELEPGEER